MKYIAFFILLMFYGCLEAESKLMLIAPDVKVDPVTGNVVGDVSAHVETLPELPATIPVLTGEVMAFQAVLAGSPAQNIRLNGTAALTVNIFRVGNVRMTSGARESYPDILIPLMQAPGSKEYMVPSDRDLFPISARYQVFWIDVHVKRARDNSMDLSKNALTLEFRDGEHRLQEAAIQLDISDNTLPPLPVHLDLNEYGDKYLHPFRKHDVRERLFAEQKAFNMAAAHYGVLNVLPYRSQRGIPHEGMVPKMINDDLLNPLLDWTDFDRRFGGYFDGRALNSGQPLDHYYLPFNPNWPAPFELYRRDREKYERIWAAFAPGLYRPFSK